MLSIVVCAGCGPALPATSFVDKLRLLAVQAEPPEISPGESTTLTLLVVEPTIPGSEVNPPATPSPLTQVWLACPEPSAITTSSFAPCGFSANDLSLSAIPPSCTDQPDAPVCIAGTTPTISFTAPADALSFGSGGTANYLFTIVVADTTDGAFACLTQAAQNGGAPANPDHCIIAFKELTVSDLASHPARNHNPQLTSLSLELAKLGSDGGTIYEDDGGVGSETAPIDLVGGGGFVPLRDDYSPGFELATTSAAGAAEIESDGTYEVLTLSWYTTSGSFDNSRSVFIPVGCSDPTLCPESSPAPTTTSPYKPPTADDLPKTTDASGVVRYWAVVRDDRGGIGWLAGSAVAH